MGLLVGLLGRAPSAWPATSGVRINEVGLACANRDSTIQFVELRALGSGQTFEATLGLRVRDRNGTVTLDRADLFPSRGSGSSWPNGRTWLLATSPFEAAAGIADLQIVPALDPVGGTISLYDGTGGGFLALHELSYGTTGSVSAPAPGHSLQLQTDGSFTEKSTPDPRTYLGATYTALACPWSQLLGVRIAEFALACKSPLGADPSGQFIELQSTLEGTSFHVSAGFRILDGVGNVVFDQAGLFDGRSDGDPWPTGRTWLIAGPDFESQTGLQPNLVVPVSLDALGGSLLFYDTTGGAESVIHSVSYGTAGGPPPPLPGRSLELQLDGTLAQSSTPDPTNFSGATRSGLDCGCVSPACVRVNEFAVACDNLGQPNSSVQFIELIPAGPQSFQSSLGIRILDASGVSTYDRVGLFAPQDEGAPWAAGKTWLLATQEFYQVTGVLPDLIVPAAFSPSRGTIVLYDTSGGRERVFLRIDYGAATGPPAPSPGTSLQLQSNGTLAVKQNPDPTAFSGARSTGLPCPCPSPACIRINEVAFACDYRAGGDAGVQFIELEPIEPRQGFQASVGLRIQDRFGAVSFDQVGLLGGQPEGAPWPADKSWLLATTATQQLTGVNADLVIPAALDAAGGTLTLYDLVAGVPKVLHQIVYGSAGGVRAPAPGHSLQLVTASTMAEKVTPDPTNFAGQSAQGLDCPCPGTSCLRINEVALACLDCDQHAGGLRFVELAAILPAQRFSATVGLRIRDRAGTVVLDRLGLFDLQPQGASWPEGKTWLVATPGFEATTGVVPDLELALPLDSVGGTVTLYDSDPARPQVIHEVVYGTSGGSPSPPPGRSLQLLADGQHMSFPTNPTPTNFAGGTAAGLPCPCPSLDLIRVSEVSFSCANGSTETQFIELQATGASQKFHRLRLLLRDRNGATSFDRSDLFGTLADGTSWPSGRSWLIGRPPLTLVSGVPLDLSVSSLALDPEGGTVTLYDVTLTAQRVLQEFSYGSAGGPPAPAPGHSLALQPDGTMAEAAIPVPANFAGQTAAGLDCSKLACPCPGVDGIRFGELMLTCSNGDRSMQFFELQALEFGQAFSSALGLEVRNRSGAKVFDAAGFFPGGASLPPQQSWLLATDGFRATTGVTPDYTMPVLLDSVAGSLVLFEQVYGIRRVIQTLSYGVPGGLPAPAFGHSLQRQLDGTYVERSRPDPGNFAGQTPLSMSCDCPLSYMGLFEATRIAAQDTGRYDPYTRISEYDSYDLGKGWIHGEVSSGFDYGETARMTANDLFRVVGPAPGTVIDFTANLRVTGSASGARCGGFIVSGASIDGRISDGVNVAGLSRYTPPLGGVVSVDSTLRIDLERVTGEEFPLTYMVSAGAGAYAGCGASATNTGQLSFSGLPPNAAVVSCQGYVSDIAVPVLISLASSEVAPGLVRLVWHVPEGGGLDGEVSRRCEGSAWISVGRAVADGTGRLVFEDRAVEGGQRYGYRLSFVKGTEIVTSEEVWLEIPSRAVLALHGTQPNPARGRFEVSFELPDGAPAMLEVMDISGRRIESRAVGSLGPGLHAVAIGSRAPLPTGIYVIRLTRAGRALTAKACVIW